MSKHPAWLHYSKSLDSAKVAEMQKGTLYYPGEPSVCRIFFKDDAGALYLVDVDGR